MALRIYTESLQLIREMRTVVAAIGRRDVDLARQMRRALASIPLNIAEGEGQKNGNATLRFRTAMGSANEVRACLEVADAMGYVSASAQLVDELDRIARTLRKLN